jgi:hypothetical protein
MKIELTRIESIKTNSFPTFLFFIHIIDFLELKLNVVWIYGITLLHIILYTLSGFWVNYENKQREVLYCCF